MTKVSQLYDRDFALWAKEQAAALRAAKDSNLPLDWENLAEEIESLGRSDKRELASRIAVIIEHFVKLGYSPARDPRNDWQDTVLRERAEIELLLDDSPSLKREVPALIKKLMRRGVEAATRDLRKRGELSRPLPEVVDYTPEQILGDWVPPEPKT